MNSAEVFSMALASPENQPDATFAALARFSDGVVGAKLFTLMALDFEERIARRIYSNMPDAYPVQGSKPFPDNDWINHVVDKRQIFVANSIAEIARVFSDHELIASLGCESVLNLPAVAGGRVLGTLNCLHEADHYTEARVEAARFLATAGTCCFLLFEYLESRKIRS